MQKLNQGQPAGGMNMEDMMKNMTPEQMEQMTQQMGNNPNMHPGSFADGPPSVVPSEPDIEEVD